MRAYLDSQDRRSLVMQNLVRLDYVPVLPAPFVFNAGYAAMNTLHQRYGTDNDTFANSFTLAPGLNLDTYAVNLVANYTHNLKRGHNPVDPGDDTSAGYRRYSESGSVGPLFRYLLEKNHILEAYVAYVKRNFFFTLSDPANEDQSGRGLDSYVGWNWFFSEGALFNLKLGYTYDRAEGKHYDSQGYRFTANLIYPLAEKLRLQAACDISLQDYKNENSAFNATRKDRIYTATVGLTWSVFKYVDLIAQFGHVRAYSNIWIYDYSRDYVSLGVELKF
jgi:hypothetical protein